MMRFVENLENRTLFSLTSFIGDLTGGLTGNLLKQAFQQANVALKADKGLLAADTKAFHATLGAWAPTYKADLKLLGADLKALPKSPQNVQLLNTLRLDQNSCTATLRHDFAQIMGLTHGFVSRVIGDALNVIMHPTDTTMSGKLTSDGQAFQAVMASAAAQFQADADACAAKLSVDADALVAANATDTQLATDVAKTKADGAAAAVAWQAAMTQSQTDLTKLFSDTAVPA
jgi:hypothetical protein